jgi:hypothetical protein
MENLMNTTLNDATLTLGMRLRNNRCRFGTSATILLTALSALGIVSNASAESITKTFTGSVVAGQLVDNFSATRSDALGLFGTAGGSLVGDQAIVAWQRWPEEEVPRRGVQVPLTWAVELVQHGAIDELENEMQSSLSSNSPD